MLVALKSGVAELASTLGLSMDAAFDAAVMPEWLWAEMATARDAAGPQSEMSMDLFAADSPERDAAAQAVLIRVRAFVVS
jgi:hypothetical protein